MAQVKMMLNVPVLVQDAKYLDCMPPGQFGSQLRLKGTINGEPNSVMYLPGKVWAGRKSLVEAGVIGEEDFEETPEEAVNIPLLKTTFMLTNKQVAGKNYGNIEVRLPQEGPQAAPQSTKGRNAGPLLPGEEEGYLEAVAGQPAPPSRTLDMGSEDKDIALLNKAMGSALGIVKNAQALAEEMGLDIPFTGDNACSLTACLFIKWTKK